MCARICADDGMECLTYTVTSQEDAGWECRLSKTTAFLSSYLHTVSSTNSLIFTRTHNHHFFLRIVMPRQCIFLLFVINLSRRKSVLWRHQRRSSELRPIHHLRRPFHRFQQQLPDQRSSVLDRLRRILASDWIPEPRKKHRAVNVGGTCVGSGV